MGPLFPIMIKVWVGGGRHEFRYVRRSLPSLLASDLPPNARVILIDDQSPDPRLAGYLRDLAAGRSNVEVWTNPERLGPNRGQAYNFPRVVERFPEAPWFVLCDDDIIYHPGWLQRLTTVCEEARAIGLRGLFTALNMPFRPTVRTVTLPTSEVLIKARQPALNWLLPRDVYEEVGPFRDMGIAFDHDYWNRAEPLGLPAICLKPSYVQNIGYHGAYQSDDSHTAADYVGRRDLYLLGRDAWYGVQRHTVQRARRYVADLPENSYLKKTARRVRDLLFGRPVGSPAARKGE